MLPTDEGVIEVTPHEVHDISVDIKPVHKKVVPDDVAVNKTALLRQAVELGGVTEREGRGLTVATNTLVQVVGKV